MIWRVVGRAESVERGDLFERSASAEQCPLLGRDLAPDRECPFEHLQSRVGADRAPHLGIQANSSSLDAHEIDTRLSEHRGEHLKFSMLLTRIAWRAVEGCAPEPCSTVTLTVTARSHWPHISHYLARFKDDDFLSTIEKWRELSEPRTDFKS